MKKIIFFFLVLSSATLIAQTYQPSPANLAARKEFADMKFGMFIHWGASSVLGANEWVMYNRNIKIKDYKLLQRVFNPVDFDAAKWVSLAKAAGQKYIVFITRHHDGFSNWDTQQSDWKITNTPYGKDALKQLAAECKKQGIKLGLYYSILDWYRSDYPYETGRTGKGSGRTEKSDYNHYLQFMKAQLTELLTNYGDIFCIWLDGHWDQTNAEGSADRTSFIDWRYDELYGLIHQLQPACLIGNNHHLTPFAGEDFQMFERDLPGQNKSGLSYQKASDALPLETCETMNGSWGYNITDNNYKSSKELIHYLVRASSLNANLLLNIGPMPNGVVQPEFVDTLHRIGNWMSQYGETLYGSRGNIIPEQEWGVVTAKANSLYVHIFSAKNEGYIFLPGVQQKIKQAWLYGVKKKVSFKQIPEGVFVYTKGIDLDETDTIIDLTY